MNKFEGILPDNFDELVAVCRYLKWDQGKIENDWFEK